MRAPDVTEECPNCGTLMDAEIELKSHMQKESFKRARRRDWLWLVLGVPGLMLFLYLIYLGAKLVF